MTGGFASGVYGLQDAVALGLVGLIVGWGVWRGLRGSSARGCRNCPVSKLAELDGTRPAEKPTRSTSRA